MYHIAYKLRDVTCLILYITSYLGLHKLSELILFLYSLLNPSFVTRWGASADILILMDSQPLMIPFNKAYRRLKRIMKEKLR